MWGAGQLERRGTPGYKQILGRFTIADRIPWRTAPPALSLSRFLLSEALVISKF